MAGVATFAALYDVQPLLPSFSRIFAVSPAVASLALSVTTFALAFAMLVAGTVAERFGRKLPMAVALVASSFITLACAAAGTFGQLVTLRFLEGIALSGLPAVAMAYIGEEVDAAALGLAMGLYVGGTGLGGMFGRLVVGVVADIAGWRAALAVIGFLGLACSFAFWVLLPESRNFRPTPMTPRRTAGLFVSHVRDAGLPWLYAVAFLLMGAFVSVYNYLGYRLEAAPYNLSQAAIGAIFTAYLAGVVASAVMGRLADRFGRRNVLWSSIAIMLAGALMSAARPLWTVVLAIASLTFGFFGAHAIASGWVGRRAAAAKAHAASLYLFAYYAGSSVLGSLGGDVYARGGWRGLTLGVTAAIACALAIALGPLRTLAPVNAKPHRPQEQVPPIA